VIWSLEFDPGFIKVENFLVGEGVNSRRVISQVSASISFSMTFQLGIQTLKSCFPVGMSLISKRPSLSHLAAWGEFRTKRWDRIQNCPDPVVRVTNPGFVNTLRTGLFLFESGMLKKASPLARIVKKKSCLFTKSTPSPSRIKPTGDETPPWLTCILK